MTTLILGCGYLGRRVGHRLTRRGERVLGTVRSVESARSLEPWGVEPVLVDVLRPDSLRSLPTADRLVYGVGFDRSAGVSLRSVYVDGLRSALEHLPGPPRRMVYISSTGVYGQDDGSWVDEASPAEPRHESGRACLEGERVIGDFAARAQRPLVILRCAGLYGPGRIVRRGPIERGEVIPGDPDKFLNVVHIDDAASATVAALDRPDADGLYLVSDDRPVRRREYYGLVARHLDAPEPRFAPPAPGSPEARRDESNKRVSNRRLRSEFGIALAFPDITTGVPAALDAPGDRP